MLLVDRCQQMLPNQMQCPNPIANPDTDYCALHLQFNPLAPAIVDETNENKNTEPADKNT